MTGHDVLCWEAKPRCPVKLKDLGITVMTLTAVHHFQICVCSPFLRTHYFTEEFGCISFKMTEGLEEILCEFPSVHHCISLLLFYFLRFILPLSFL
jgi:hypothetical protein